MLLLSTIKYNFWILAVLSSALGGLMFLWTPDIGRFIFKTRLWVRHVGEVIKITVSVLLFQLILCTSDPCHRCLSSLGFIYLSRSKIPIKPRSFKDSSEFLFCYWAMLYELTQSFVNSSVAMSQALQTRSLASVNDFHAYCIIDLNETTVLCSSWGSNFSL